VITDDIVECARRVPIENETKRRGINLKGKIERVGPCPRCRGDDRFSINTRKQVWHCRKCKPDNITGDVIGFVMWIDGLSFNAACEKLAGEPKPKANGKDRTEPREITAENYVYEDEEGTPLFRVERIEFQNPDGSFVLKNGKRRKTFRQSRPDLASGWLPGVQRVRIVPYRLPQLIEAVGQGRAILIVEGERKVDLLGEWNVPATCNAMGAEKWGPKHSEFLRGAEVIILPDWMERGGTVEQLYDLIQHQAEPFNEGDPKFHNTNGEKFDGAGRETSGPTKGVSLSDFVAYMPQHSYIFMPTGEMWPAASVSMRVPPPADDSKGKPVAASKWLDIHKPVEQMTWAPGKPKLIKDKLIADGGWIERSGCTVFNLYKPPIIQPIAGDVTPWINLIQRSYPDQADHIVSWLAQRVQRPHEKVNHALVLGGEPGIGKDTILEPVKQAIGPWNFADVSPKQVLGRFSGFLKSVILRVSEARDLGEFDRYAFHDHMKVFIAAPPDVLRIDEKHIHEYYVPNLCGVIITSNHKTDGIYLPADDRRHLVAWSNLTKDDFADDYWRKLYAWYASGGNEYVAHYLINLDTSAFDPKAPPPKTQAFWEIVNANRAPEDAELADVLDDLDRPDVVTLSEVTNRASNLQPAFAEWLRERKNRRSIPHRFEDCGYVVVSNPNDTEGRWKISGSRQTIYGKSSLTVRDRLNAAFKFAGTR
jgi:Family of unknown function (DUF5906)/CHC2 zinc finger